MLLPMIAAALLLGLVASPEAPIDRHALVQRHNVVLTKFDPVRPLQVGNGEFAYGMDITGMQSFTPLNTMSQWGWHEGPPPKGQTPADFAGQEWDTHGRKVRYAMPDPQRPELSQWLASNPHRINLGRIGLSLTKRDGNQASVADLSGISQQLDLWSGTVTSRFSLEGVPVQVLTACHPESDTVAFKIQSPLLQEGRISVFLASPGNNPLYSANFVGDWNHPAVLNKVSEGPNRAQLLHALDATKVYMGLQWASPAKLSPPQGSGAKLEILQADYGTDGMWLDVTDLTRKAVSQERLNIRVGNHLGNDPAQGKSKRLRVKYRAGTYENTVEAAENEELFIDGDEARSRFVLKPDRGSPSFSFTCTFAKTPPKDAGTPSGVFGASKAGWEKFWRSGGALDLSGSTDPRWKELERRVVLSQYLMAVNEAGSTPPQESGLVNNGWYGRFHMEMVWWHAAHWALWNRWSKVRPSLDVYRKFLASSRQRAAEQGYLGARWPKAVGPEGREWPHEIHALLIWQQPHPIFFAELDYRAHPTRATLDRWQPIVDATADFMASYAFQNPATGKFDLGPPLHVVSENIDPRVARNPAFELGYWRFGLRTAQEWRKRMGLKPKETWAQVLKNLAPLPVQDGTYVLHEGVKDMWTRLNFEHPALTGTFGMLPGDGVSPATMRKTLNRVAATWDFNRTWGWDFPMLAMCAARLGEPERAIDFLLHPSPGFQFDERGLATGGPFPYFPSNGGLLYATAMMAAGWDGAPRVPAPGFPKKGWRVRFEGMKPAL
jgi:hypothetical protein